MNCAWSCMANKKSHTCCNDCHEKNCKYRCKDDKKTCGYYNREEEMNNKKIGSNFEHRVCDYLASTGCWVHFLNPAPNGSQPFDIIACKDNICFAIDAKTCSGKSFSLSRIENNQYTAFKFMNEKGNQNTFFAIEYDDTGILMVPSQYLISLKEQDVKSVKKEDLLQYLCK